MVNLELVVKVKLCKGVKTKLREIILSLNNNDYERLFTSFLKTMNTNGDKK
ncbi:hypothetical protein VCHA43P282_20002 [Vibrio chagasii]|nr:hypothetical protein VCHA43P282_20002 [Vibrio chagasii]